MWADFGGGKNNEILYIRGFDTVNDEGGAQQLRAAVVALNTITGAKEEVPSSSTHVPPYRVSWLGNSRFAHYYRSIVEVWVVEDRLRREQVFQFDFPLVGFRLNGLSPHEISLVHRSSPVWYVANIRTGKVESRRFNSPALAQMQLRASRSRSPDIALAHAAIGTDGSGTLYVVGGQIFESDLGGSPIVAIKPDGTESALTIQLPAVNGTGCLPWNAFITGSETAIWTLNNLLAWYRF
jgi:hypothetical protein